jgi:hypothetical protein
MMQSVLSHEENGELTLRVADDHDLSRDQRKALVHIVQFVILQQVRPQDVPERVEKDLQLGRQEARQVACDLLGWRFLPMEWYIGPVQPVIRNLGGDPEHYLAELREIYPEVFLGAPLFPEPKPDPEDPMTAYNEKIAAADQQQAEAAPEMSTRSEEFGILDEFLERLGSESGRAEILLRLTGLSSTLEERMDAGAITREVGEGFLERLESIANAIETRDMNPLEMQSLRRRMQRILEDLTTLGL